MFKERRRNTKTKDTRERKKDRRKGQSEGTTRNSDKRKEKE